MAVEILTVSLSDESIQEIARQVFNLVNRKVQAVTQSNPPSSQNPQDAGAPVSGQQGDPWLNSGGQYLPQPTQQNGQQYQQGYVQQQAPQPQGGHNCAHGPMTFVPAGVNRNTNEPYSQYWKCPLQRGAQGRCRNVYQ